MPNRLRRCTHCKAYGEAVEGIKVPAGWFHDELCMILYAQIRHEKTTERARKKVNSDRKKEASAKKRDYYANDIPTRKEAAKKWCHLYIRMRDKDKPCPCCGEPLGDDFQAGHFLESGNNPQVRYDEDNIHGQRLHCNYFKGGDSGGYEASLVERIGITRVERLKSMKGGIMKRTAGDYKDIEEHYKAKCKELSQNL